jgi:hypothetical protein
MAAKMLFGAVHQTTFSPPPQRRNAANPHIFTLLFKG